MRTFHDLEIFEHLHKNPNRHIGQRSFYLTECYLFNYHSNLQPDLHPTAHNEAKAVPSISEYIENQLSIQLPDQASWTWALEFQAENDGDLFELYFEWVFKYENAHPISLDHYSLRPKFTTDITNKIKHICSKPLMYGILNLAGLRAYIDGHFFFKNRFNLPTSQDEKMLFDFIKKLKSQANSSIQFHSWDRELGLQLGISPFSNFGKQWAFPEFIQLLESETDLQLSGSISI